MESSPSSPVGIASAARNHAVRATRDTDLRHLAQVEDLVDLVGGENLLALHELSTTTATLKTLLPELKQRGYRFVTLDEYWKEVAAK